jgi:serine/threonine protein kinase
MALATCGSMVAELCRLQLLDDPQARELTETLAPRFSVPRDLARELLRREWLTAFQVKLLLQERGDELLFGPYVLLERLGEGGMGQVYKARHRALGRIVAIKIIRKEALANPNAIPRFEREVQASAKLTHPNVVRAFDAAPAGGTYYLAMEFIEGVDLAQLVKQGGPLAVPQACAYVRQAALGLQHAHEMGFIHRDIKPANLFLTRKVQNSRAGSSALLRRPHSSALLARPEFDCPWGLIKILDFGLARLQVPDPRLQQVALTLQGAVMGTPDFLAPEQAWDSHTTDIRADLYSLGCTFYFLLSGRVPFVGGSLPEKLVKHQKADPDPVGKAREEQLTASAPALSPLRRDAMAVPPEVAEVVQRLMAKKPTDRFQTPQELAERLAELQERAFKTPAALTVPIVTSPTPATEPDQSLEATMLVAKTENADSHATTQSLPGLHRPRSRLRTGLVFAGFLACCTLAGRLLSQQSGRADGQTLSEPAPAAVSALARVPDPNPQPRGDKGPDSAAAAWQKLQGATAAAAPTLEELLAFRMQFPGTAQAEAAKMCLIERKSPLDRNTLAAMPKENWPSWLPDRAVALLGTAKALQNGSPLSVAFSPDGTRLARASGDNSIRQWLCGTLKAGPVLQVPQTRLACLVYSPDGTYLAAASPDGSVLLWDIAAGNLQTMARGHQAAVTGLVFAPDGKVLASCGLDGTVKLWDVAAAKLLCTVDDGDGNPALAVAFSPDATTLVCGYKSQCLRLWHLEGDRAKRVQVQHTWKAPVRAVAFAPGGKSLVAGGGNGTLVVCDWDGQACRPRTVLGVAGSPVHVAALSPDGRVLATVSDDKTLRLWDLHTAQQTWQWSDQHLPMSALAFAPDGRHLAVACNQGQTLLLRLAKAAL